MVIAVYDENLMWTARLRLSIEAAGHTPLIVSTSGEIPPADIAVVNLGSTRFPADQLVPQLKSAGCKIIAHAGHKEKPLIQTGNDLGCDLVVSNSTLTNHLVKVIAQLLG